MTVTSEIKTSEPDEDLAARFARDAEPLFDVLARGARKLTRSDADAEDLLQDTLLHAYAGFGTFHEGSNLKAWLFRILYNRWVSAYRVKQRRPSEVLSTGSPIATWPTAPRACPQGCARPRSKCWMRCLTTQSKKRWPPCPTASGPRCTTPTSRDTRMRRPPRFWVSRMEPSCRGRHVLGSGCAQRWLTSPTIETTSPPTTSSSRN